MIENLDIDNYMNERDLIIYFIMTNRLINKDKNEVRKVSSKFGLHEDYFNEMNNEIFIEVVHYLFKRLNFKIEDIIEVLNEKDSESVVSYLYSMNLIEEKEVREYIEDEEIIEFILSTR